MNRRLKSKTLSFCFFGVLKERGKCYNVEVMNMKFTKKQIRLASFLILASIFLLLMFNLNSSYLHTFDMWVYGLFKKSDTLTLIMKGVTFLGEGISLILISVLLVLFIKDKFKATLIPLNLGLISLLNYGVKILVKRPRPTGFRLILIDGYSFPSGHSASSLAFYGFLIYLLLKDCGNNKVKKVLTAILVVLIFFIGVSRIYLGVHYASDVLGGFLLATIYLIGYITFVEGSVVKKL